MQEFPPHWFFFASVHWTHDPLSQTGNPNCALQSLSLRHAVQLPPEHTALSEGQSASVRHSTHSSCETSQSSPHLKKSGSHLNEHVLASQIPDPLIVPGQGAQRSPQDSSASSVTQVPPQGWNPSAHWQAPLGSSQVPFTPHCRSKVQPKHTPVEVLQTCDKQTPGLVRQSTVTGISGDKSGPISKPESTATQARSRHCSP